MRIDLTGDYETSVYDVARRLLAGGASPAETVETYRNGVLSMSGVAGELARLTMRENPKLHLVRYVPFSRYAVAVRTGGSGSAGRVAAHAD